jgi:hypothetical protein
LRHQQAALTAAYQANVIVVPEFPGAFTPGAGFWGILDDGHDHGSASLSFRPSGYHNHYTTALGGTHDCAQQIFLILDLAHPKKNQ